jgi:hypothetical protein
MADQKLGIYVTEYKSAPRPGNQRRRVIIAVSAYQAAVRAVLAEYPVESVEPGKLQELANERVTVGRLGDYHPGVNGAEMVNVHMVVATEVVG